MKNFLRKLLLPVLIFIINFFVSFPLFAQDGVNIHLGAGIPELINGSVRFQFKKAQLGFSVGIMPVKDESVTAFGGAGFIHFGENSRLSERPTWYGRFGLDFLRDANDRFTDKYLFLNMRVGKEIYFSKKFGLDFDLGLLFQLSHVRTGPDPWLDIEFPIVPSLGAGLFYKL